jgi:hypothetical protein
MEIIASIKMPRLKPGWDSMMFAETLKWTGHFKHQALEGTAGCHLAIAAKALKTR